METPSDVPEEEAYLPREPGAGVARCWPPSIRPIAIEWARRARSVGNRGLAVDDTTLELVADAIMDPAHPPPWSPLTAAERRDGLPDGLWDALQGYLIDHPGVGGRVEPRWHDGRLVWVVGIEGDVEAHRAALAEIGGERVVVERRQPVRQATDAEREALGHRLDADELDVVPQLVPNAGDGRPVVERDVVAGGV